MKTESIKVLIIDDMHASVTELFTNAGFTPDYRPDIKPDEVYKLIPEYHGLVVRSKMTVGKELIDEGVNLRFIARAGAGLDKVDYEYVEKKGIALFNAPEGNRDALAEHTIGMILTLFNKINSASKEVKKGIWLREENRGWELMGRTVGIFGYGFMGEAFSQRLSGFGCEIIAYDKYKTLHPTQLAKQVSLEEFLEKTEVLSIHVPLTEETRFLFDTDFFEQFSRLKFIINTSRGEVVKLSAVNDLLDEGKIFGACLDVLENEKLDTLTPEQKVDFDKLSKRTNVILTPHVAGWTQESYRKINEVIVAKLVAAGMNAMG
ncbi:MAG: phosphoglycerate dehydrogenase [Cyclobacteriaceae bacterium]